MFDIYQNIDLPFKVFSSKNQLVNTPQKYMLEFTFEYKVVFDFAKVKY